MLAPTQRVYFILYNFELLISRPQAFWACLATDINVLCFLFVPCIFSANLYIALL